MVGVACMENWIKCQRNIPKLKIALGKMANTKTAQSSKPTGKYSTIPHAQRMYELMENQVLFVLLALDYSVKNGEKYRHRAIAIADLSGVCSRFEKIHSGQPCQRSWTSQMILSLSRQQTPCLSHHIKSTVISVLLGNVRFRGKVQLL